MKVEKSFQILGSMSRAGKLKSLCFRLNLYKAGTHSLFKLSSSFAKDIACEEIRTNS